VSHEDDLKVNHYLRGRLKEAEEKIYLLEQHQLEVIVAQSSLPLSLDLTPLVTQVENLKYQTMKPPPYELKRSSEIKMASESLVNKLLFDQVRRDLPTDNESR
jgi:hypothetical protein